MFTAMKFFQTGVVMSSQPPSVCALLLLFCFIDDRVVSQQSSIWYNWFCESLSWVYREIANIPISSVFICAFWVMCFVQVDAQIIYFPTLFFFKACFVDSLNGMMREGFWKSDLDRCLKWTFVSFTGGQGSLWDTWLLSYRLWWWISLILTKKYIATVRDHSQIVPVWGWLHTARPL